MCSALINMFLQSPVVLLKLRIAISTLWWYDSFYSTSA